MPDGNMCLASTLAMAAAFTATALFWILFTALLFFLFGVFFGFRILFFLLSFGHLRHDLLLANLSQQSAQGTGRLTDEHQSSWSCGNMLSNSNRTGQSKHLVFFLSVGKSATKSLYLALLTGLESLRVSRG